MKRQLGEIGTTYVVRAADGVIKIGFTRLGLDGVRARMTIHRKMERRRGFGPPILLATLPSTVDFDRQITDRLWRHRSDRGSEWFRPMVEVLSVTDRLLEAAKSGVLPPIYSPGEHELLAQDERIATRLVEALAQQYRTRDESAAFDEGYRKGLREGVKMSENKEKSYRMTMLGAVEAADPIPSTPVDLPAGGMSVEELDVIARVLPQLAAAGPVGIATVAFFHAKMRLLTAEKAAKEADHASTQADKERVAASRAVDEADRALEIALNAAARL